MASIIERVSTDVSYGFGAVADVLNLAITEGLVSFTTDTNQIFVDMEGERFCYDSIIMVATEREMMSLTTFASGKLYFAEDTKCLYMNENNLWVKVFETTEGIIAYLPTYLSLNYVDVLPTTGDAKSVYLINNGDYPGVPKQFWLYDETAQSFYRIVPTKAEIVSIVAEQFELLNEDLQVQYNILLASLGGETSEVPDVSEALAELLTNYPLKSTVYTKEETDAQIASSKSATDTAIANTIDDYTKSKFVAGEFADVAGEITLNNKINTYKATSASIITFNLSNLPTYEKTVVSFDLIITGCKATNPVINANIKWLENVAPDYVTFDNVLVSLKTLDGGSTWLAGYQGGWN